jgi:hypothetical protein
MGSSQSTRTPMVRPIRSQAEARRAIIRSTSSISSPRS